MPRARTQMATPRGAPSMTGVSWESSDWCFVFRYRKTWCDTVSRSTELCSAASCTESNPDQDSGPEIRQARIMKTKPRLAAEPVCTPLQRNARDPLDLVLAHIERNLFEPLSVGALADVADLSPFHFSRLFTARVGESVMAYVRRRRMLCAAARLGRNPGVTDDIETPALIDLALDCGFES